MKNFFPDFSLLPLIVSVFLVISCHDESTPLRKEEADQQEIPQYPDGLYCAIVYYHNSGTGTRSTYTLEVEVNDGELTMIHWPNGGWLDSSHFTPPEVNDGHAEFVSDRGYEYEVDIIGNAGQCN